MTVAIQVNTYKGDGTPLEVKYCFGEIKTNEQGNGIICFRYPDYPRDNIAVVKVKCAVISVHDCMFSLTGTSEYGGKVDVCFAGQGTTLWNLAEIEEEVARLTSIFENTKAYYIKEYGDISDVYETARKNLKDKK